MRAQLNAVLGA